MGKQDEARSSYGLIFPLLEDEPRCARVDWERHSLYINIGNTHSRDGNFELADAQYKIAETLGNDHLTTEEGSSTDGNGMVNGAKRARAFALKKAGREAEGKAVLKEVIEAQIKANADTEKKKKDEEEAAMKKSEETPEVE